MRIMVVSFATAKLTTFHCTMGLLVNDKLPHDAITAAAKLISLLLLLFLHAGTTFSRIRIHGTRVEKKYY
jgi:hypothetical protein